MELEMRALRAQMEALDMRIADLFESRMILFGQMAALSGQQGLTTNDRIFELDTIDMLQRRVQEPISSYIPVFFESLYKVGHDYQSCILEND